MNSNKIKNLCAYIDKNKAKNYPIGNHLLADATDYIKNVYFKMLAVILQQGTEISNAQSNLYQRMIAGADCDYVIEDYLRQALEIEIEEYVNFTGQCRELPIKYRFILDALLLTAVEPKEEDQLTLVANFAESLKVRREEMAYLAQLAKAALAQSISVYVDTEENRPAAIPDALASEYLADLAVGNLVSGQRMTIATSHLPGKAIDNQFDLANTIKTPVIKLSNMKLSLKQSGLSFQGYQKVILENCEFEGGSYYPVVFSDCMEVIISNCVFLHFSSWTILESRIGKMEFTNVRFEDCMYNYSRSTSDWIPFGCVIHSDAPTENGDNKFTHCKFISCGGKNNSNYYSSAFISDCKSTLLNCSFKNCWHYHSYSTKDSDNPGRTMFAAGSSAINCQIDDCASII